MSLRLRLALVVLSAWASVSLTLALVANSNFRTVDRVLAPGYRPELESRLAGREPGEGRMLLRYLAGELNRRLFRWWAAAQLGLAALLLVALRGESGIGRGTRTVVFAAAGVTLVLCLALTPAMLRLGPPFDFLPRPVPPEHAAAHRRFLMLHGVYFALDLLKLGLLASALVLLLRREPASAKHSRARARASRG